MSFNTSSFCALCGNHPSITSCDGCQRKFCFECLSEHRQELSREFDDLINCRNELFEIIHNQSPNDTTGKGGCFDEINRWQTEMHANIDRIAATARENARQLLSEASKNVRNEFDQVSQDLQQRQKSGGYVESDLNRIRQQLNKLSDIVQRSSEQIHIDTSTSKRIDWDTLLFIVPNKQNQKRATSTVVPQSPMLNTFPGQRPNGRMSMPNNQMPNYQSYVNTLPPSSTSYSTHAQKSSGRSASVSTGFRPTFYTCVCCKTMNQVNENGHNICSVCKSPMTF